MSKRRQGRRRLGRVCLVGAGPGDPGLLTLRGAEVLKHADLVVFDRLVGKVVLAMAPRKAIRIDAGKTGTRHRLEQEEIHAILARHATAGKTVVRLKGGDPYLFGRGAEERTFLEGLGINVEVIPGVSSAIAVPEAAGIPLTHRGLSSLLTVVTGHDSLGKKGGKVDWAALARLRSTIVVLMGVKNMDTIMKALVRGGMPASTPVAVIERGTASDQVVTVGTLRNIALKAMKAGVIPPAIIVIGKVVNLRPKRGKSR